METARAQFQRVLLALEDLVSQEETLLRTEEFDALPALQSRAAPLVDFLAARAGNADEPLRRSVSALIERRSRSQELLARQLVRIREELLAMQSSRQRIAQVKPAYRQPDSVPVNGLLCAHG
jgi:hypothetical protein